LSNPYDGKVSTAMADVVRPVPIPTTNPSTDPLPWKDVIAQVRGLLDAFPMPKPTPSTTDKPDQRRD
jgi:hypothetical protein